MAANTARQMTITNSKKITIPNRRELGLEDPMPGELGTTIT